MPRKSDSRTDPSGIEPARNGEGSRTLFVHERSALITSKCPRPETGRGRAAPPRVRGGLPKRRTFGRGGFLWLLAREGLTACRTAGGAVATMGLTLWIGNPGVGQSSSVSALSGLVACKLCMRAGPGAYCTRALVTETEGAALEMG
jgi:hypothetical protein